MELGCTHSTEHTIKVIDDTPLKSNLGEFPHCWLRRFRTTCGRCWSLALLGPSQSVWCNAVVLVRMKDGSLQFCIDFCHLNACMKKDSYPLPRIQEALESLVGAGHFSCLDIKLGFWQIKMEDALKQYTAFTVGNLGFFKCNCMPFGFCNAPVTFQKAYASCLGELNLIYCLIYLDDLIMFSQTTEEHLHRLHIVFDQLREYNLKLKP